MIIKKLHFNTINNKNYTIKAKFKDKKNKLGVQLDFRYPECVYSLNCIMMIIPMVHFYPLTKVSIPHYYAESREAY